MKEDRTMMIALIPFVSVRVVRGKCKIAVKLNNPKTRFMGEASG
jgi:hypothetical protein